MCQEGGEIKAIAEANSFHSLMKTSRFYKRHNQYVNSVDF